MALKEMKEGIKKGVGNAERQDVLVFREGGAWALKTCQME